MLVYHQDAVLRISAVSTNTHMTTQDLSRQYLSAIARSSNEAIITATASGEITGWNASAQRMFGRTATDARGKRITLMMPGDNVAELSRLLKQAQKGKGARRVETVCVHKNGQRFPVSLSIAPITDEAGKVRSVVTVVRDLTRRVRGREALINRNRELLTFYKLSEIVLSSRPLEQSYTAIVKEISLATGFPIVTVAIYDETRDLMVFRGLMNLPGQPETSVLELPPGQTLSGIIMRTGKPIIESHLLGNPRYQSIVMRGVKAQTFVGHPMKYQGRFIGCLNLAHTKSVDVSVSTLKWIESLANYVALLTERKRIEEELRESREQLRELSRETHSVLEEERRRIAREIHDQLGQELSLFQLELGLIQDQLLQTQQDLRKKLKSMSARVDSSIRTVQKISADLRPTLLDNLGLGAAVEWAVKEFQKRTKIRCHISIQPAEVKVDQDRSTALFRALQEGLTNVLRHAKATKVSIQLTKTHDAIVLAIRDNGVGIQRKQINDSKSVGLTGMRERVRPWGGKVVITGEPREGTEITVTVPMKP
jgi:PAS domain S-box-containing protein